MISYRIRYSYFILSILFRVLFRFVLILFSFVSAFFHKSIYSFLFNCKSKPKSCFHCSNTRSTWTNTKRSDKESFEKLTNWLTVLTKSNDEDFLPMLPIMPDVDANAEDDEVPLKYIHSAYGFGFCSSKESLEWLSDWLLFG